MFGELERTAEKGIPMNSTRAIAYNYSRVYVNLSSSNYTSNLLAFMRIPRQENMLLPIVRNFNKTVNVRINVPVGRFAKSLLLQKSNNYYSLRVVLLALIIQQEKRIHFVTLLSVTSLAPP